MEELRLYIPDYHELFFRQNLLSDPETMAFNRGKEPAQDYHPETGCIDFPRENWALWYDCFIGREPELFYAVLADGRTPLGEVSYYTDENGCHPNILLKKRHRGKGYCAPGLRLLCQRAFENGAERLSVTLSTAAVSAVKGYRSAGFRILRRGNGTVDLEQTREEFFRGTQKDKKEATKDIAAREKT